MTNNSVDLTEQMEVVAHRVEFIDLLHEEGPLATREIVDALDHSRSTVTRALRALREVDLIEKTAAGYAATLPGVMAADEYRRYRTASEAIFTSKELLAPISEQHAPPVDLFIGAETIRGDAEIPVRALEIVSDRVRDANTVQAYLPTLVNTHLLRVWHRGVVVEGVDGGAIVDPDLLTVLKGQYPQLLSEMAATDGFAAFSTTGPPYGVVLTSTGDTTTTVVIVYEADTAVRGVVTNESAPAVEWARTELEQLKRDATEVTDDLDALSAAATDGMPELDVSSAGHRLSAEGGRSADAAGHPLPLGLEAEGIVRLSPEYFDTHRQAAPAVSWRTGFTLAEVQAGHAVDRLDIDGQNLTDHLVEQLRAEANHVVLGPPGSGKSTICMAVACAWYDRGHGPVLYRERGSGDHFASTALLEAYLRQTDGHALVVVEDVVRDEANAIFDVMQALDDSQDVTFLLDARTHEWRDADAFSIDPRRDAYRRTAIDQVSVPPLDEQECARFVDHFTDLIDADLDFSGTELFALVQEGTAAGKSDGVPPGDALVAQHHLSRRYEPPVDTDAQPPTVLDETARHTYQRLIDAEARLAPDLAVLIALLTAAGIPIAGEYLYTLASADEYAELDEAFPLLEGQLLFEPPRSQAGPATTYRTLHETWALRFLEQFRVLEPAQRARDRFGQCVTRLLALADEPQTRHQIKQHLGGRTPHLHRIEADPGHWADELAERIFSVGQTNASLAPLFGETTAATIELPEACSAGTVVRQAYWRGEMNRLYGDLDRAEREFCTLRERVEAVDIAGEGCLPPAPPDGTNHDVRDERESGESGAQRIHWRATSLTKLGRVAEMRGELETAAEHYEESLALFREIGDREGEAWVLGNRGIVARWHGELEAAAEYHEESLALYREIGDRHGEAWALDHLGVVARKRGDLEAAAEYHEESLGLHRETGDREGEAYALDNRGMVARKRGEFEAAAEYHEESLALSREIGDRDGEAWALNNLGVVARLRGDLEVAREYHEESFALFREIGDRYREATIPGTPGIVARQRRDLEAAAEYHEESLALFREIGDRHGEAKALDNLGAVARDRGELERARARFAEAADLFVTIGAGEAATALTNVVDVCEEQGDINAAREWCRRAIDFAERTNRANVREKFSTRHAELADSDDGGPSS